MTTPRYVPKQFMEVPTSFGHAPASALRWHESMAKRLVQLEAAKLQNDVVFEVNSMARQYPQLAEGVVRELGCSRQRWQRLVRGDVVMRLEDMAAIATVTKRVVSVEFKRPGWGR